MLVKEVMVGQHVQVNGYNFTGTDDASMDYALNRAISSWYSDRTAWHELEGSNMRIDWSWDAPAQDYIELYHKAMKRL